MKLDLNAFLRDKKEKLPINYIAAVIYGKDVESKPLKVRRSEFEKLFAEAGESNLINLNYDNNTAKVLVKGIQRDILKHTISHVDFFQVNMKEKISTEIPLQFVGESRAVREQGGIFVRELNEVKVECLPGDLIDHIKVDISVLKEFNDNIKVADLELPKGIELLVDTELMVAMVIEPKVQIEPTSTDEEKNEGAAGDVKEEKGGSK